jgi:hypothetical protein
LDPNYRTYAYIGGGPVYLVPAGMPGAGNLLGVYHAERNTMHGQGYYSLLGLARSTDGGRSWHDLGEIVEANRTFKPRLSSFEIGLSQLVVDPTGTFFYVYFPDWLKASGSSPSRYTVMSVARVKIRDVLSAAFASTPRALPPFEKLYLGTVESAGHRWPLQRFAVWLDRRLAVGHARCIPEALRRDRRRFGAYLLRRVAGRR